MNICTDQMLLALADPDQIMGLSRFSRDARQGRVEGAQIFPILSGGAEDILVLKPDVVDRQPVRQALDARDPEGERRQSRRASRCRARSARCGTRSARWASSPAIPSAPRPKSRGSMRRLPTRASCASNRHFRVLPLSRRGWVPGRDSFVGAILGEAGLSNAAGELGVDFGGFASME